MKEYFSFNPEVYDYWLIINTIKKHYPMGIENNEWMCYTKDPAAKILEEIIVKNIHQESEFLSVWDNLCAGIEKDSNKELIGTTYGQSPSFSAEIVMDKFENEKIEYRKTLCFAISLIGPFYTVYGIDETGIKFPAEERYTYYRTNVITTSPFEEFEIPFLSLQKKIEDIWPDYRLVPFNVNKMYVRGLRVPQVQIDENTVYHALFNHFLFYTEDRMSIRGKEFYGSEKWLLPGARLGGWTAYSPGKFS